MLKYSIKRIILAFITCFIILTLTFILIKLLPTTKAVGTAEQVFAYYNKQVTLGYMVDFQTPNPAYGDLIYSVRDSSLKWHYFYVRPVMEQYGAWITNIFTKWDWGTSTKIKINFSAMSIIFDRLPTTFFINIISTVLAVPLGILLGIWAGLKKNKPTDHIISTLVMIFISIPSFVVISLLIFIFGYQLHWLPTIWPASTDPTHIRVLGYFIPVLALSFGSICGYCRFVRAELCEVMSSEYLLLARTKGLTKNQAITRHALKNAFVPILPSILAEIIGLLGGSTILEQLYSINGIGKLYIEALNAQDYNVLMVDMAVFTIISLLAGIVLDLSYGFIDPRIRMGAGKTNG